MKPKILIIDKMTQMQFELLDEYPIPRIGEKVDVFEYEPHPTVIGVLHSYKDQCIYIAVG